MVILKKLFKQYHVNTLEETDNIHKNFLCNKIKSLTINDDEKTAEITLEGVILSQTSTLERKAEIIFHKVELTKFMCESFIILDDTILSPNEFIPITKNFQFTCSLSPINNKIFSVKTFEEIPKEMTLTEIEQKLGHKIKIIS